MSLVTAVVVVVFGGLALLLVVGAVQTHRVINVLRERHKELYESLGRPALLLNNSISNSTRLVVFIWSKRLGETSDQGLIRSALWLRWIQCAYVIFFATALGLFILAVRGAPVG